jgi:hypothetical protein
LVFSSEIVELARVARVRISQESPLIKIYHLIIMAYKIIIFQSTTKPTKTVLLGDEGGVTGIIAERSFQALGMAYRALRNSWRYKEGQAQSVEDALVEPPASKGLFGSRLRVKE